MEIQSELKKAWILKSIEKAENAGALVDAELITAVFNINIIDAKKLFKYYDLICPDANTFIRNYANKKEQKPEPIVSKAITNNAGNEFEKRNEDELPF